MFALCVVLIAVPIAAKSRIQKDSPSIHSSSLTLTRTLQTLPRLRRAGRMNGKRSLYARYPKTCIAGVFSIAALCGAGIALWYTKPKPSTFQKNLNWILGNERGVQVGNYCAAGYGYFLGHKTQIKYATGGFGIGLANGALLGTFATWLYYKLLTTKKSEQEVVICPPALVAQVQQLVDFVQTQQKQLPNHQHQQQ